MESTPPPGRRKPKKPGLNRVKMYVTIKSEGNVGTVHSVNVDGKEIIPELKYNIAPHKFVHRGHEGFELR